MWWHLLLIGLVVAIIIFFQIRVYLRTRNKRKQFDAIFPDKVEAEWLVLKRDGVQIVSKIRVDATKNIQQHASEIEKLNAALLRTDKRIGDYTNMRTYANANGDSLAAWKAETALKDENKKKEELLDQKRRCDKEFADAQHLLKALDEAEKHSQGNTRRVIIDSINRYLDKNKDSVTDFNLIRDIIDRNCDAVEEEIQTQLPVPLYFGLMGTMLGILIGVGALVFSGSLTNLLSSYEAPSYVYQLSSEEKDYLKHFAPWSYSNTKRELNDVEKKKLREVFDTKASDGVNDLFGGIALAMFSSIIGILLTTIGSIRTKNSKAEVEEKKHAFISWLQAELLPKISTDFSSALVQLGHDLSGFNNTFSSNAKLLQQTINGVSEATLAQTRLLQTIEQLDIARLASANIQVYERLQNCTQEMAGLAKSLHDIQESIQYVGNFMDNSVNEYEKRHTFIQDASGKVDIAIRQGQEQLSNATSVLFNQYNELLNMLYMRSQETTEQLAKKYDEQAESLHKAIIERLSDVHQLENELKNLVAVKSGIANLEKATLEQNHKLDKLSAVIHELAQVKVTGGATTVSMQLPPLYKVLIISATSIVSVVSIAFLVFNMLSIF